MSWRRGVARAAAAALLAGAAALAPEASPAAARAAQQQDGGAETRVGGGVYLYHFAPVDLAGVEDETEVYAAYVRVEHESGPWLFHGEARWRDTKLRDFYPSTTWVQEGWAAYRAPLGPSEEEADGDGAESRRAGSLTVRAGKIYTRLGRFWDGSFFGNLHYFDGMKLDPDFGAEAVLSVPVGGVRVEARGQHLLNDDRVNGALTGRDLEGITTGDESGSTVGALHVEVPILGPRAPADPGAADRVRVRAGVSGMLEQGTVGDREGRPPAAVDLEYLSADVEVTAWGHRAYAEFTDRSTDGVPPATAAGPAGSRAGYWLAGAQLHFPPLHLRYNYSRAEYGVPGFTERIHQPGLTLDLRRWLHAMVEYDDWTRDDGDGPPLRIDRSLNVVLLVDVGS